MSAGGAFGKSSSLPPPSSSLLPPSAGSFGIRPPQTFSSATRQQSWSPIKMKRGAGPNNQESAIQEDAFPAKPRLSFRPMSLSIQVPPVAAPPRFVPPSPMDDAQSDNIRVVLRIRPMMSDSNQKQQPQRRCLEVAPDRKGVTLAPSSVQEKRFGFDRVFPESSEQDDLFQNVGRAAVENTLKGYNGSIFAYGQTGSGKTFTMLGGSGLSNVHELRVSPHRGLMPRIFDYIFQRLADSIAEKGADNLQANISCSYLEIYNEKIFDLLEDNGSAAAQQPKNLREDSKLKQVYVDQLREVPIESEEAAIEWLRLGSKNRHMASTDMNRESSRSHAVFTIKLVQTERTTAGVMITRRSNLHLIDLAGSEKQRQTHVEGQRLKEAAQINKSLSALGNVIMSLVDVSNGQKRHVHYRDSKLTFLLRDSLGGNAITSIIATISAEEKYFTETLSTLKFAQRAKYIKNNAVQNEDADSMVPILKQEIEKLRQEIEALRSPGVSTADSPAVPSPGQPTDPSAMVNQQSQQLAFPPATSPKKNRWEPALDVMQKLLLASGAATPADLEDEDSYYAEAESAEVRCDRLEMLLYRMICRLEEYKEIAFAPDRSRPSSSPPPSGLRMPSVSLLQAPRKYGLHKASSNQKLEKKASTHTDEELEKLQERLKEMTMKAEELESENNLIRQELCELLEWKALVEEERAIGNDGGFFGPSSPQEPVEPVAPTFVATDPNEELVEVVNMYRSLFDEVKVMIDEKKPVLRAPRSPGSGSSVTEDTASLSYASEDESDDQESVIDVGSDAGFNQDDGDNEREMRRIHGLNKKLERKLDQFQDVIQRLEKELQATQDELETSSAATKFAEFQLQQMRDMASEEASKQAESERTMLAEIVGVQRQLDHVVSSQAEAENVLKLQMEKLQRSNKQLEEQLEHAQAEKRALDDKYASAVSEFDSRKQLQDEEMKRLLAQKAADDVAALKRDQELAQHEKDRLQWSLGREQSDEARKAVEAELAEANARIQQLENEVKASDAADAPVKDDGLANSAPRNYLVQPELQRMLDAALADNAELLTTIRDLQVKRESDSASLRMLSSRIHLYALQSEKAALLSNKESSREKELAEQVEALQQQVESLQKQLVAESPRAKVSTLRGAELSGVVVDTRGDATDLSQRWWRGRKAARWLTVVLVVVVCVVCSSACWVYWWQQSDESQRTRAQLHLSQRKVKQLEEELTRTRSSSVSSSLATEFFCGI